VEELKNNRAFVLLTTLILSTLCITGFTHSYVFSRANNEKANHLFWLLEAEAIDSASNFLNTSFTRTEIQEHTLLKAISLYCSGDYQEALEKIPSGNTETLAEIYIRFKTLQRLHQYDDAMKEIKQQKTIIYKHPPSLLRVLLLVNMINPIGDETSEQDSIILKYISGHHFKTPALNAYTSLGKGLYWQNALYPDSAHFYYQHARKIMPQSGVNDYLHAILLTKIADIQYFRFNYSESIYYYQQSLKKLKTHYPYLKQQLVYLYMSLAYFISDSNPENAKGYLKEAEKLALTLDIKTKIKVQTELAFIYERNKNIDLAEKYYLQTLKLATSHFAPDNKGLIDIYYNLHRFYYRNKQLETALHYIKRYISACEQHPESKKSYNYYLSSGILAFEKKDYQGAQRHFKNGLIFLNQGLSLNRTDNILTGLVVNPQIYYYNSKLIEYVAYNYYKLYEKTGLQTDLQTSFEFYNLLIKYHEKCRNEIPGFYTKASFRNGERDAILNTLEIAFELYETFSKQEYLDSAYILMEKSRDQVLFSAFYNNTWKGAKQIPDSLLKAYTNISTRIELLTTRLYEKNAGINQGLDEHLYQNLINKHKSLQDTIIKYHKPTAEPKIFNTHSIQQNLKPNEILLEYAIKRSKLFCMAITKDSVFYQVQSGADAIIRNIERYVKIVNTPPTDYSIKNFNDFTSTSHALFNSLISPFEKAIAQYDKLIIIPEDILAMVPFGTLIPDTAELIPGNYEKLPYLLKKHVISYGISGSLFFQNRQSFSLKPIVAIAPDYPFRIEHNAFDPSLRKLLESLPTLEGAKKEVKYLKDNYNANIINTSVYGEDKITGYFTNAGVLHLAMHSITDSQSPEFNALVASPIASNGSDGLFHNYEIMHYNLNNPFVVLSACNTGTGKLMRGEGIQSLAKSFILAGSAGVLNTLWAQNDASAQVLIKYFYEHLHKKTNPANALNQAKIKYLQTTDPLMTHPYYWSGYICIGDPSVAGIKKTIAIPLVLTGAAIVFIILFLFYLKKRNSPLKQ